MRSILLENDILDGWAYWGYGLNHLRWAISTIARRLNRSCTQTHPLRIAGEVHYNSDLRWLREGLLRELGSDAPIRPLATRCECKIASRSVFTLRSGAGRACRGSRGMTAQGMAHR